MANVSSNNSQKALVPKLRFPGFEGEWHSVKLSDKAVFRKNRGQINKAHFVSTENMKQNCAGIELYPDTEYAEGIKFQEADILIANIRPYLKKAWLATFSGACSADVLALCPVDILPSFLYSVIGRDSFFDYVMSSAKGSKMPRGDKTHIMAYSFGVPGCKEQKRISDMITWLDKRIDAQRRLVEALKSYKRGVIQGLFSNHILGNTTYNHWKEYTIKDLFSNIIDKNHPTEDVLTIIQGVGTVPRNSVERRISYDAASLSTYKKVNQNDFILHLRSFEGGLEIANQSGIVSPAYTVLRSKQRVESCFFYAYFRSYEFINRKLRSTVEGIRDGKSINMNAFWNIKIPLPDLGEQESLSRLFASIDKRLNLTLKLLGCTLDLKRKMISELFI